MTILPQGEDLRKAVKWISEQRNESPGKDLAAILAAAAVKFDLSPKDAAFLERFCSGTAADDAGKR